MDYPLSRSAFEYQRLERQGKLMEPMTRRLFAEAGIQKGMKVLDVGSGSGDLCLLLADLVGTEGSVVGVELDDGATEYARERAAKLGKKNIRFMQADVNDYRTEEEFDAIVGRFVLLYQREPGIVLEKLKKLLRPGGVVAFQEPWFMNTGAAQADVPAVRIGMCILETMKRSGAHMDLGLKLHRVFRTAGLPTPNMWFESVIDPSDDSPIFGLLADSYASVLPKAIEYGIATDGEFKTEEIAGILRGTMNAMGYAAMALPTVNAWCRTPPA